MFQLLCQSVKCQSVKCQLVNQLSVTQLISEASLRQTIKWHPVLQSSVSQSVKHISVEKWSVTQSISHVSVSQSVKYESVNQSSASQSTCWVSVRQSSVSPSIKCQSIDQTSVNQSFCQSVKLVSKSVMSYWVSQPRVSLLRVIQSSSSWVKSQSVMQSICQSFTRLLGNRPCLDVSKWGFTFKKRFLSQI